MIETTGLAGSQDIEIRHAQREWEKSAKHLGHCYESWKASAEPGEGPFADRLSKALALAEAYHEERTLYETFEGLVLEVYAQEERS